MRKTIKEQSERALQVACFIGYVVGYQRSNPDARLHEAFADYVADFDSDTPVSTLKGWWFDYHREMRENG